MLTQLISLGANWSRINWSEVAFLVGAGVAGAVGLIGIREYCWLCTNFGAWSIEVAMANTM